ncbi:TPA: hypothetical protein ACSVZR_003221 [Bacillus cereus]
MNVSDAAYRTGIALKKSKDGRKHKELYDKLCSELSSEARKCILDILNNFKFVGFGHHFRSFLILNDILEENKDNEFFKTHIEEIFSKGEYFELLKLSDKIAQELEETIQNLYKVNEPIKYFGTSQEVVPKLRRALQDMQIQISRSGFQEWLLLNNTNQNRVLSLTTDYEGERESLPFSKKNRLLRIRLATKDGDLEILNKIETITLMMGYVKQIIFNAHLDNIVELNVNQLLKYRLRNIDDIKIGVLKINDEVFFNPSFLIKLHNGYKVNYGIAKSFNSQFQNRGEYFDVQTKISVYLFPENDTNFFR